MRTQERPGRHAAPTVPAGPRWWRSWTPASARAIALVLLASLALLAWWWWQGRPRPVDVVGSTESAVSASSAATDQSSAESTGVPANSATVTVHVVGRVRRPGIVTLPEGARVADAIDAAGGLRDPRVASSLNLARRVVDGERIEARRGVANAESAGSAADPAMGLVDINSADAVQLQTLPGIGPVLAGRIIAWREENGPFPSVEILGEVSGIGPAVLEGIVDLVTV